MMALFRRLPSARAILGPAAAPALAAAAAVCAFCLLGPSGAMATSIGETGNSGTQTLTPAQLRELWATIDVCNDPDDPPHTIGVRGSMPPGSEPREQLYMRFRLQYLDSTNNVWVNLNDGADSGFVMVGSGKAVHQYGWSFVLKPAPDATALTLRGVITFQWRVGTAILQSLSRATSAGHKSLAGAAPAGFSAATCPLS